MAVARIFIGEYGGCRNTLRRRWWLVELNKDDNVANILDMVVATVSIRWEKAPAAILKPNRPFMGRKAQRTLYRVADAVEGGDDGGGGDGVAIVVVVEARGGAWLGGSGRSVDEDHFWFRPENFFGDGGGRWRAEAGGGAAVAGIFGRERE
ncbi:hypothetical protein Tco_1120414 [Tanacetum coccineum]